MKDPLFLTKKWSPFYWIEQWYTRHLKKQIMKYSMRMEYDIFTCQGNIQADYFLKESLIGVYLLKHVQQKNYYQLSAIERGYLEYYKQLIPSPEFYGVEHIHRFNTIRKICQHIRNC